MTNERIEAAAEWIESDIAQGGTFDAKRIAMRAIAAADRVALAQAGEQAQRLHAFGERGEGDFFQQCAATLAAQAVRIAELEGALCFYRDEWMINGDGDPTTPGLSRTWEEPTTALLEDEGRIARSALTKLT